MSEFYLNEVGQWCFRFNWLDLVAIPLAVLISLVTSTREERAIVLGIFRKGKDSSE